MTMKNALTWLAAVTICGLGQSVLASTSWSTQDYDLYSGDFDGDGKADILYIAKDARNLSGIARAVTGGFDQSFQAWPSNFLGIPWARNPYTVVILQNTGASNKRASILLQSKSVGGDSYLLQPNAQGRITGISQPLGSNGGVVWSADQHRLVAGDFNADGMADVFLQSTSVLGTHAIMAADTNGQFSASSPLQQWSNGFLGFRWATSEAVVYAGNFDGQNGADLLIQARPRLISIDYDPPFSVPVYPPNMNGVAFAHPGGSLFQAAPVSGHALGYYAWSRNAFGVDWSPQVNDLVIGNFDGAPGDDIVLQAKRSVNASYLLTANGSATVFATGAALASNQSWSADAVKLVAGTYAGGSTTGMYLQSLSSSGTNAIATSITGGSVATTAHDPSAPLPGAVQIAPGRTPGSFAVSSSGSATYSMSVWTPPGVGELQLPLGLTYSSRGGNGLMGAGWGLAGLSEISRCGRTWAQDGAPQRITLTTADRFCLDGQQLKLVSGTAGQSGSVYATEFETFSRIEAIGSAGSTPTSFRVTTANGLIYDYGLTSDAQIMAGPSAPIRTWALSQIRDRAGNNIKLSYYNDALSDSGYTNGTYRIKEILYPYTANGQGPFYRVQFGYGARPTNDIPSSYFAGYETREPNQLDTITIQSSSSGSWVTTKSYSLSYTQNTVTSRIQLRSVQECSASRCFPATSIDYQNGAQGWSSTATGAGVSTAAGPAPLPVDLNGDGLTDLLYPVVATSTTMHWWVVFATGSGYSSAVDTGITAANAVKPIIGDFAGRGQMQLLGPQSGNWLIYTYNGSSFASAASGVAMNGEYLAVDYDGDGKPDLVSTAGGSVRVRRNTTAPGGAVSFDGSATTIWTTTDSPVAEQSLVPRGGILNTADFNSDGRADILVSTVFSGDVEYNYVTWNVLLSNGFGAAPTLTQLFPTVSGYPDVGDLNADGCTDVFSSPSLVFLSNCAGDFAPVPTGLALNLPKIMVIDWDGDGRTDVLYNNSNNWYVLRSTGHGFAAAAPVGIALPTSTSWFALDQNGDGLTDLAYVDGNNGNALKFHLHAGSNTPADLATSFTDGFGINQTATYVSIAQNNYTRYSTATFPEQDYQGALHVVDQFTASDGTGGTYQKQFWYYGARTHMQGRGFEGFYAQRSYDSRNALYTYDFINQTFPYTGMTAKRLVSTSSSNVGLSTTAGHVSFLTTVPNVQTITGLGGYEQRFFPFVEQATTSDYEYGGALNGARIRTTQQTFVYGDGFGNPTQVQTSVTDDDSTSPFAGQTWESTLTNSFLNDTSAWCVGLPIGTTLQQSAPGQTTRLRSYQFIPDSNHTYCRLQQRISEPTTTALQTTETFGYDSCGNMNSVAVVGHMPDGSAMSPRTTTINYNYFTSRCQLPESVTNALGHTSTTSYQYDFGMPQESKDPNGVAVSWLYDDFGRRTRESRADGTATTWKLGHCVNAPCWGVNDLRFMITRNELDANGAAYQTQTAYYDGFQRLRYGGSNRVFGTWTIDTARTYDSLGRLRTNNVPYSISGNGYWLFSYDLLNRRTAATLYQASGAADRTFSWGYAGRTVSETDPLTHVTAYVSDVTGKLRRVIDPSPGGTTRYDYDAFGNLNKIVDPIGATTTATHNVLGFRTDQVDADAGSWHFDGNSLNEAVAWRDARNNNFSADYDALGRIWRRIEPEGTSTWTWGNVASNRNIGSLEAMSGYGYSENLTYDTLGRLKTRKITSDNAYYYDYAYNAQGALDTLTYPDSPAPTGTTATRFKIQYGYSYGVPYQINDVTQGTAKPLWTLSSANDFSSPTSQSLGDNLISIASTYSPLTNEPLSVQSGAGGSLTNRQNLAYQWDAAGNLHQRQDLSQGLTEVFTYDALDRLRSSTLNGTLNFSVDYNAAGNIRSRSDVNNGSQYVYGDAQHPHAVTTAGPYSFTYDANGNAATRNALTQSWASFNLPLSLQTTVGSATYNSQFSYGPNHDRYRQNATYSNGTENTMYVGGLLEKVSGSATGGVTSWRHYVPTPSGLTVIVARNSNAATTTTYALSDHLGSSEAMLDGAGNLLVKQSFGAFGQRRASNWTAGNPTSAEWAAIASTTRRGFTFHESLDNLGLVHMNGRVYDPNVGRFLSADPIISDLANSQMVNPYSYVGNRPLSLSDPTGYEAMPTVPVQAPREVVNGATSWATDVFRGIGQAASKLGKWLFGGHAAPPPPPQGSAVSGNSAQTGVGMGACTVGVGSCTGFNAHWVDYPSYEGELQFEGGLPQVPITGRRSECRCGFSGLFSSAYDFLSGFGARNANNLMNSTPLVMFFGGSSDYRWFTGADNSVGARGDRAGQLASDVSPYTKLGKVQGVFNRIKEIEKLGAAARGVAAAQNSFFQGTRYSQKVLKQMQRGAGEFHSFPESVRTFESTGTVRTITGGDGIARQMLEIPGTYGGREGVFQFMKEADGLINHRLFVPN